jgi:hypothetical protein
MWSARYSCQILIKLAFSRHIFEKFSNIKFHENPSSRSRVVPCGHTEGPTDTTKLTVAFCNFANARKTRDACFLDVRGTTMVRKCTARSGDEHTELQSRFNALRNIRKKDKYLWSRGCILHQDNAPVHKATSVLHFSAPKQIQSNSVKTSQKGLNILCRYKRSVVITE